MFEHSSHPPSRHEFAEPVVIIGLQAQDFSVSSPTFQTRLTYIAQHVAAETVVTIYQFQNLGSRDFRFSIPTPRAHLTHSTQHTVMEDAVTAAHFWNRI